MTNTPFILVRCHSAYSLCSGACEMLQLMDFAAKRNLTPINCIEYSEGSLPEPLRRLRASRGNEITLIEREGQLDPSLLTPGGGHVHLQDFY